MAGPGKRSANEPEPRPIIVKKIIVEAHGGHHGGAWKVAYADFVTAMMAFFLLMWLLGATTEKQRKGLADYFTPTLVTTKEGSAGSNGLFGGDSMTSKDNYPTTGGQGNMTITIPRDATGTRDDGGNDMKSRDRETFQKVRKFLEKNVQDNKALAQLKQNIRFTETREGLRIDLVDQANFSMFAMATDRLLPQARNLIGEVAKVVKAAPNGVIVRGHTDGLPYAAGRTMNNWLLSSARAEATRRTLAEYGVSNDRFARIDGVADREPYITGDVYDPRNRRMSIILAWSGPERESGAVVDTTAGTEQSTDIKTAIAQRDDPRAKLNREVRAMDMGGTGLPAGAIPINAKPAGENKPGKH
jgi:chemotaxis protein MotB